MQKQKLLLDPLSIQELPVGHEQLLLFTTTTEETTPSGKTASTTTEREVEVHYLGGSRDKHLYQLFLLKTKISLVRKPEPELVLLRRLTYAFDEVMVRVNDRGIIIEVLNFPFVQYRWAKVRAALMQDYHAEKFQHYFSAVDELAENEQHFLEYLRQPAMYGLYFNGYRRQYDDYKEQLQTLCYGPAADFLTVEERIEHQLKASDHCQLIELKLTSRPLEGSALAITGQCRYLDGVLELCKKQVDMGTKKLTYSAKWIGLKKFFR